MTELDTLNADLVEARRLRREARAKIISLKKDVGEKDTPKIKSLRTQKKELRQKVKGVRTELNEVIHNKREKRKEVRVLSKEVIALRSRVNQIKQAIQDAQSEKGDNNGSSDK